jgi:VacB/RNase II family 3'-5' exoribonuclease
VSSVPTPRLDLPHDLVPRLDDLRTELEAPTAFPEDVLAEAAASAAAPRLPDLDRTDLPMVTIDPPGSMDLDQAVCFARDGSGFTVSYAIADVAAFVTPAGPLDREVWRRGVTLYAPDTRIPLHPPVLGEDAASLLPDQVRPAVLWTLSLDATGELTGTEVRRALVRSRERLHYAGAQAALDDGSAGEQLQLLREVGTLRQARARERGAVDLPTPEQEVSLDAEGRPALSFRAPLPAEGWNAQISLLTGTAAARLMLAGGVGLLRTLPPAEPEAVQSLQRSAAALGVAWPAEASYGEVVSGLDPTRPEAAALLVLATRLLRGAGYTAFDGQAPEQPLHSAVAMPYAHATAPLRRLADRYVSEVCLALCAGEPVPGWAREALPLLPEAMAGATRRANALDRASVDLAEAVVLAPRVGETFSAMVVDTTESGGTVQLSEPAVRARCDGADLPLGERLTVRLVTADPVRREVVFARA